MTEQKVGIVSVLSSFLLESEATSHILFDQWGSFILNTQYYLDYLRAKFYALHFTSSSATYYKNCKQEAVSATTSQCAAKSKSAVVRVKEGMFADLMKYVNQPHFMLKNMGTYSLNEISTAISESKSAVVGSRPEDNIQLSELLYFEPFIFVSKDFIKTLFVQDEEHEAVTDKSATVHEQIVTEEFLARVAQCACACTECFAVVFNKNPDVQGNERKCLQILRGWKASQGSDATYSNFHQTLDSYSIYCGRNPLVSSYIYASA